MKAIKTCAKVYMKGTEFMTNVELEFTTAKCPPLVASSSWYKDDPKANVCSEMQEFKG